MANFDSYNSTGRLIQDRCLDSATRVQWAGGRGAPIHHGLILLKHQAAEAHPPIHLIPFLFIIEDPGSPTNLSAVVRLSRWVTQGTLAVIGFSPIFTGDNLTTRVGRLAFRTYDVGYIMMTRRPIPTQPHRPIIICNTSHRPMDSGSIFTLTSPTRVGQIHLSSVLPVLDGIRQRKGNLEVEEKSGEVRLPTHSQIPRTPLTVLRQPQMHLLLLLALRVLATQISTPVLITS